LRGNFVGFSFTEWESFLERFTLEKFALTELFFETQRWRRLADKFLPAGGRAASSSPLVMARSCAGGVIAIDQPLVGT
jgi:hypothetical protein